LIKNILLMLPLLAASIPPSMARPTPQQQLETWVNLKVMESMCSIGKNQSQFIQVYAINAKQDWVRAGLGDSQMNAIIRRTTSRISDMYKGLEADEGPAAAQMIFCKAADKLIIRLMNEN